jgi:hypothetical protein
LSLHLDVSVILPNLIREALSAKIDRLLDRTAAPLFVSDFAEAEVVSALSRLVRTGDLEETDARARLAGFDIWRAAATENVDVVGADVRSAGLIVRQFHLMLRRLGAAIATVDLPLAHAALALGVAVTPVWEGVFPTG